MGDNISRQAVLEWLKTEWDGMVTSVFDGIKQLPSTDQTTIRAKVLMTEKDFEHWAENFKKQGENIICIPYDAEVYEPIGRWIPCSERLPDNDGDIIMTTDTRHVVVGFHSDGAWYYINKEGTLSRSYDEENAIVAWMTLPKRYKGGE